MKITTLTNGEEGLVLQIGGVVPKENMEHDTNNAQCMVENPLYMLIPIPIHVSVDFQKVLKKMSPKCYIHD